MLTVKIVAFCDALYFGITLPSVSAVLSDYTVSLPKTLQPWQSQITVEVFAAMCWKYASQHLHTHIYVDRMCLCFGTKNFGKDCVGHVKQTDSFGDLKVRGMKTFKWNFMKLNVDWVCVFQNKTQWQAVMNKVMKLWII